MSVAARSPLIRSLVGAGIACVAATLAAVATATPADTRSGPFRLRVERTVVTREASHELDAGGRPTARAEKVAVEAYLTVRGREEQLDRIAVSELLKVAVIDRRGRPATTARGSFVASTEEQSQEASRTLRITATGLSPGAQAIRAVTGEIPVFAEARRIRFHVPWLKDETPLAVDVDGGRAVLDRFDLVEGDAVLHVSLRPPAGFQPSPMGVLRGARAVDIYGNLVERGGIQRIESVGDRPHPSFRFYAPGLRRQPSRLMIDALFVRGPQSTIPFRVDLDAPAAKPDAPAKPVTPPRAVVRPRKSR